MEDIELWHGDCLELMKDIPDKSVDCVICDLPYGTTACKWDSVIDLEKLWEEYKRIITDKGVICLFGQEPFSSRVRISNDIIGKIVTVKYKEETKNKDGSYSLQFPVFCAVREDKSEPNTEI